MEEINKISSSDWFMTAEESIRLAEWEKRQILNDIRTKGLEEGRTKGLEEGRTKGLEEGRTKGLEEGRTEGLEQGIEQGIEQEKKEIILSLLKKNMSLEDISDITGKTIDEIKEISKNN